MRRLLPIVCLAIVLGAISGTASATTEPSLTVAVRVALASGKVTLSQTSVKRGYYVQFRVRNTTSARRTFSVAGRKIAIPAKKSRYMVVDFLVRGRYRYTSAGPRNSLRGIFRVI